MSAAACLSEWSLEASKISPTLKLWAQDDNVDDGDDVELEFGGGGHISVAVDDMFRFFANISLPPVLLSSSSSSSATRLFSSMR